MDKVLHVVLQLSDISNVAFGAGLAVPANVQAVDRIPSRGERFGHHVHATASGRGAVHEHHAAFDGVPGSRVRPKGELSSIASRNVARFR